MQVNEAVIGKFITTKRLSTYSDFSEYEQNLIKSKEYYVPQTRSHAPAWECIREFDSVNKCFFVCRVEVCIPTETVGTRVGLESDGSASAVYGTEVSVSGLLEVA